MEAARVGGSRLASLARGRSFKHLLGHVVGKSCLRRKSKFGKTPLRESGERDGASGAWVRNVAGPQPWVGERIRTAPTDS